LRPVSTVPVDQLPVGAVEEAPPFVSGRCRLGLSARTISTAALLGDR
jgi:hypothetical protein